MKTLMAALILFAIPAAIASAQPGGGAGGGGGAMLERLRAVDLNSDGAITKAEARTAREAAFRALDTNNDGFISDAEKAAVRDGAAKKRPGGGASGGGGDANGDGKVSRDEFVNAPYRMFDRLDANHNDIIDASELETARTMLLQRKQGTP